MVENSSCNGGDTGLIWSEKIPHAMGQLNPRTATTEPIAATAEAHNPRAHPPQQDKPAQ